MAKRRKACRLETNPSDKRRMQARFAQRGWRNAVPGRLEWLERREMLDGTAYTASMLVDANSSGNAYPVDEVNVGSKLFFFTTADTNFANSRFSSPDPASLWVTDGTSAGTQQLTANLTLLPPYLGPTQFDVNGNLLFFASAFGSSGSSAYPELWISDGTVAGTHELADIQEAFGAPGSWNVGYSVVAGNELYFELFASDGYPWGTLMESDGTAAGTMPVPDPAGGPATIVSGPVAIGDTLYMLTRDKTFLSVTSGEQPTEQDGWDGIDNVGIVAQAGNYILYQALPYGQHQDLGVTDGMPNGPNQFADDGSPDYFGIYGLSISAAIAARLNNHGVFIAANGAGDEMIWATDGTMAGTKMLASLSGKATFLAPNDQPTKNGQPAQYVVDGKAFFEVSTLTDTQLWVTDGTGATMLEDFTDAPDLDFVGTIGGEYLFIGSLPNEGTATLWASDGVGAGLIQLASMDSPTLVQSAAVEGGAIVYEMGGPSPYELWQTDGTPSGTLKQPVNNNTFLANIGDYAIFDGSLQNAVPVVFTANGAPNGTFQVTSPEGDSSLASAGPPALIDDQSTAIEDLFLVGGTSNGGPVEPWIIAPATSVTIAGGLTLSGSQGVTLSDQTLATFTDPNGDLAPSSYSADIQWGDGKTSTATITGPDPSGVFTVTGSHLYASDSASPFKISIVINRPGSPDAGVNDTAKIAGPTEAPQVANVGIGLGAHLQNQNIAASGGENVYQFHVLHTDNIDVAIGGYNSGNPFTLQVTTQSADGGTPLGTTVATATGQTTTLLSLSPGTYFAHVTGSINNFNFSIVPDVTSHTTIYYVNDGNSTGDIYTTAPGNDANNGLTPATPKATLQSVLDSYTLGPNSLVLIDTGTYTLSANIVLTAADSGVTIAGYNDTADPKDPTRNTIIDGGNSAQDVFELDGAQNVTLAQLDITGGVDGVHADDNSGSTGLTISNTSVYDNTGDGIYVGIGNDDPTIVGNTVDLNPLDGMYIGSDGAEISGNTSFGNDNQIHVGGQNETIEENQVYGGPRGIFVEYITAGLNIVRDNTVHDILVIGIYVRNGYSSDYAGNHILVVDNTVYRSGGYYGGYSLTGGVSGAGIGADANTLVERNLVFDNIIGISAASYSQAIDNRVFNNSQIGILSTGGGSTYQGNTVYDNGIGVWMNGYDTVTNNVIYENATQGVLVTGPSDNRITNNIIYQRVGDAVAIQNNATNVTLENNILEVSTGYDINVAAGCENGFQSDYNDLYATGSGKIANWGGKELTSLADWHNEAGQDSHTISADPQFVKPSGADGILGFSTAADANSPAQIIDDSSGTGFTKSGTWTTVSGGYEGEALQSGDSSSMATYTFNVAPGWYEVAAAWPATSGDAGTNYTISNGNAIETVAVDQSQPPKDFTASGAPWKKLGDYYIASGAITVRLSSGSGADIVADAVLVQKLQGDHGADDDFQDRLTLSGPVTYNSFGGKVSVTVADGNLEIVAGTTVVASGPLANVTSVTINGADGVANDFTLDYSSGMFVVPGGIAFNGGALPGTPSNSLSILGGSFAVDTFNFNGAHDGSIQLGTGGQLVNYTNMTPLVNTGTAAQAVFKLPDGTVTATLDTGQTAGTVQLVSGNNTFETTTFTAPSQSLAVNAGNGSDTIKPTSNFYNAFNGNLTVQGAANVLPLHMVSAATFAAAVGTAFTKPLATFEDPNGAGAVTDYGAAIDWGDGVRADNGSITVNGDMVTITGTHTYTQQGSESPVVTIAHGGVAPVTATASVAVSDAALVATPATLTATAGASETFDLATFTDPGGAQPIGDYSASINWGDNTAADNGSITLNGGIFTISSTHTYAAAGTRSPVVTLDHGGAASVTATATVEVASGTPFATSDAVYVMGSGAASVSAAEGLLKNDTGPTQLSVTAGTVAGAQGGTFMCSADGSFTYTPGASFAGYDSVQFTVTDASGDTAAHTVTVLSQHAAVVWKFYESVLNRTPDPAGLQYWTNYFNSGGSTGDMAFGFFESDELLGKVLGDYYEQYLLRPLDADGLAYWKSVWHATGGPEQIKAGFADSQEFYNSAGGTPQSWLTALYQRILNRMPDSGGESFWLNYYQQQTAAGTDAGTVRYNIALGFFDSAESYGQDVAGWFQEYLFRAPTDAEKAQYVSQMQAGGTDRTIEQEITNLPEYANNPAMPADGSAAPLADYYPTSPQSQAVVAAKDALFFSM